MPNSPRRATPPPSRRSEVARPRRRRTAAPVADRSRHLPRLRHPRHRRQDARRRRRRADRPGDRHADGRDAACTTSSSAATAACPARTWSTALIDGLRKAGRDVIDIGMAPTPMVYFAAYHLRTGCCVVGHRQPQPAGLQRLQDGGRRRDAVRRRDPDLYARIAEDRLHRAATPGNAAAARHRRATTSSASPPTCSSSAG